MELSRRAVVILGILSIGVIIVVAAWFAWPSSEDDIKETLHITGNNNKVKTTQTKDFSLIHIEGLKAETGSHITNIRETAKRNNLITWGLLGVIFLIIMTYIGHYRMVRIPQKLEQRYEAQKQKEKLENIEETLVEHGYMKETKNNNKKKAKGRKVKRETKKEKREKEQEEQEEYETE